MTRVGIAIDWIYTCCILLSHIIYIESIHYKLEYNTSKEAMYFLSPDDEEPIDMSWSMDLKVASSKRVKESS